MRINPYISAHLFDCLPHDRKTDPSAFKRLVGFIPDATNRAISDHV